MGPVLIAAAVVAVQGATGAVWWAIAAHRRRMSAWELLGMGLALGTVAALLGAVLAHGTALDAVGWALPSLATVVVLLAVSLARPRVLRERLPRVRTHLAETAAVAVGLVAGLGLLVANWVRVPLPGPEPTASPDLYFFEALARGIAEFGPAQSILMTGGDLRYHWFAYGWAGELAQIAGTEPFVALSRVLPTVVLVAATAIVASWAARLSSVRWVPALAVLLVVAGGYTGALYGAVLNIDSPSQSFATVWLLALVVSFTRYARRGGVPVLLVLLLLASATTGGKASHALVAAGGMLLATIVGLAAGRPWGRRAAMATVLAGVSVGVTYLLVLSGVAVDANLTEAVAVKASTWQGLDPFDGPVGVALGTAALVLAVLARVAGLGWLLGRGPRGPEVLVATGGILVGLAAMLLLSEGINELWFILAASAPGAVLSAVGVGAALGGLARPPVQLRRPLAWAVAVAVPASVVTLLLTRPWPAGADLLHWLAPVAAWVLVPAGAALVLAARRRASIAALVALSVGALTMTAVLTRPSSLWTVDRSITTETGTVALGGTAPATEAPEHSTWLGVKFAERYAAWADAAAWVEGTLPEDAVLATSGLLTAEVPALTGRQMFLAGMPYQFGLGRSGQQAEVERRAAASAAFTNDPSPATAAGLCAAGVDYAWLERDATGIPADAVAYQNKVVTVVRLPGWACAEG